MPRNISLSAVGLVTGLVLALGSNFAKANLIVNGDFETGNLSGWNPKGNVVVLSDADLAGIGGTGTFPIGHNVACFGSGNNADDGIIFQVVDTNPGTLYFLSYTYGKDDSGAAVQSIAVSATNVSDNASLLSISDGDSTSGFPFDLNTVMDPNGFSFTATGSQTKIEFSDTSLGTTSTDGLLDNIVVVAAPEPVSLALVAFPAAIMVCRRRR